ncbi:iron complex transport system permease protein [Jatrophihabitans endophyticus]|uniref:Iron complex transport system permease protein n=1 Tax=Jatrophihabitans endophyticus TaxID=1206085 RepID=A0A1M5GI45_9ACTN|nr:iron chelate uptake ABC transporter family permease subunit [Jatrophihabitans endophyticus]SHG03404.1 iron complex transport system permease protein [Jatrophihabitans endophyticus]
MTAVRLSKQAPDRTGDAAATRAAAALIRAPRLRRRRRYALVVTVLVVAVLTVATIAVSVGDLTVSAPDIVRTILGHGTRFTDVLVLQLRLPRVVLAMLAGAALALSGALFQALLHNALASPDILGISGGASVATVLGSLVLGWSGVALSGLAFGGAVLVALVIYGLAWDGTVAGNRFVLVGIGVAFMVTAALGYVLTRAEVQQAQVALVALVGGVGDATWTGNAIAAVSLGALLLLAAGAAPSLRVLQLGDDTATGLGVPADRRRLALLALAVMFAAVGVAGAGPLAFVAFMSAPIARRLLRDGSSALVPAALVGALLVLVADLAGQHLIPGGTRLPAGVLTGAIGAPYLLWLLATRSRTTGGQS